MYCKDCKNMGEFMLVERFYPDEYLEIIKLYLGK